MPVRSNTIGFVRPLMKIDISKPNILIIPFNFSDSSSKRISKKDLDSMSKSIHDYYFEQSYGKVQMFTNANGWIDILNVGINQLPNSYDISYVSMPREVDNPLYLEKQATVRSAMELDAARILRIALQILYK